MSQSAYQFRGFRIRSDMLDAIKRYTEDHEPRGDFLRAVISNDLRNAVGYADDDNLTNLPAFVAYFHNIAPGPCWGSPEKYLAWIGKKADA